MFCRKCGSENTDDSIYCKKCGEMLEPEDETRVARRGDSSLAGDDDEAEVFSITPTLKFVKAGYLAAVIAAFFLVAFFSVFIPSVSIWIAVLLGMALLLIPAFYHLKQKLARYTLTDSNIVMDTGLISRTTQSIPLTRVQDVTVRATVSQRMLRLGDIVIDNSGSDGECLIFRNVDLPRKYADQLLKQVRLLGK